MVANEFPSKPDGPSAPPGSWYYLSPDRIGPLSREDLDFAITACIVTKDTPVWTDALENWSRAGDVKELAVHGGWGWKGPRKASSLFRELGLHVLVPLLVSAFYFIAIIPGFDDTVSSIPTIDEMPRASEHDLTPVALHGFVLLFVLTLPLFVLAPLYWALKSARLLYVQAALRKCGEMSRIVSLMTLSTHDEEILKTELRRRR